MSRAFLSKVAPAFPPYQRLNEAAAAALMAATIQDLLGEEGPQGEHLELLVQVIWLLNHLASAIAAQRVLTRRQEGLHGQLDDEPTPHELLAADLAEPLAGVVTCVQSRLFASRSLASCALPLRLCTFGACLALPSRVRAIVRA